MKVEKLNSFILARNAHKIKEYSRLQVEEKDNPGLLEKSLLEKDTDATQTSITRRNFASDRDRQILYQEILLSSIEYFDLFIVNRPIQTLPGEVAVVKEMEQAFLRLQHNIDDHRAKMTSNISDRQSKEFKKVSGVMDHIIQGCKLGHRKGVDRVRRAYRSDLASIYAKISLEAKRDLEVMQKKTKDKHEKEITELQDGIQEMKVKSICAEDERAKAVYATFTKIK
jgi:hypothetical protein